MGFWDALRGRTTPVAANLDSLFAVPNAALSLQSAIGLIPTGAGSVCYRAAAGAGFAQSQQDALDLLAAAPEAPAVAVTSDEFGFTWLSTTREASDSSGLCTDLHAVNTTLEAAGFGPALLCSLIVFAGTGGQRVGLVYLYKQGTFYPFAPSAGAGGSPQRRDNLLEMQVRDTLAGELPVESELSRWLALWGAPGL